MVTKEWFEKQFADYDKGDGWGIRWRASQAVRYDHCLEFIKKYISDSEGEILEIGCGFGDFTFNGDGTITVVGGTNYGEEWTAVLTKQ